jgi:hypothetical protein
MSTMGADQKETVFRLERLGVPGYIVSLQALDDVPFGRPA